MRKRQLFYDLLLFSSVLGVTLTSQIQVSNHSGNKEVTGLSFMKATTAKADTTDNTDATTTSEIAKYSDMNNAVVPSGAVGLGKMGKVASAEEQSVRTANLESLVQSLEANANKPLSVKSPLMGIPTADLAGFKTLESDYAYSLEAQKNTRLSGNNQLVYSMLWQNLVADATSW